MNHGYPLEDLELIQCSEALAHDNEKHVLDVEEEGSVGPSVGIGLAIDLGIRLKEPLPAVEGQQLKTEQQQLQERCYQHALSKVDDIEREKAVCRIWLFKKVKRLDISCTLHRFLEQ